jgi:outer membrane receptor protein involved in Fe transport
MAPLPVLALAAWLAGASHASPPATSPTTTPSTVIQTATITGTVVDASGGPVPGAVVLMQGASGTLEVRTDHDGTFASPPMHPGPYVVTAVVAGFTPATAELTLDAGATARLALTLSPAGVSEFVAVASERRVTEAASKLAEPLHETPRALTVVDSARMREQNFRTVNDALAYVPGMTVNSYRAGGYHFYARGFRMLPDQTLVDGFAGINAGAGFGASLFGVEEAVMLRGPAGLLYGAAGSPGGLINLVTKKPLATAQTRMDLRAGGYAGGGVGLGDTGTGGVEVDSTGPLAGSSRVRYRALALAENAGYFTAGVVDTQQGLNGSLTVDLDQAGRYALTPLLQWQRADRPAGGGIVMSPTSSLTTSDGVSGPIDVASLTPNGVNFSSGGRLDETWLGGVDLRGRPNGRTTLAATYRYIAFDTAIDQFAPQVNVPQLVATRTVSRVQSKSDTERRYHNVDVNGSYEVVPGGRTWRTTLQAGVNSRFASTRATSPAGPVPGPESPIHVYTGAVLTPLVSSYPALLWNPWSDTTYWNTYVQSRTALHGGRMVVTLGLGRGQNVVDGDGRGSGLLPNAGVVLNATPAVALFGSFSTSYNPVDPANEDAAGRRNGFDATTGTNLEAGAKYDLPGQRASVSASVFRTRIENGLVQSGPNDLNPNGNRYFVEAGTRESQGVELSGEVRPLSAWRLTGGVSYLDAIYTGEGPASAAATLPIPGTRAEKSPVWSWNLWTRYDVPAGGRFDGLGASLGIVWQAERLGGNGAATPSAPDPLLMPAFTRLDAGLFYRLGQHLDLALNAENLLDEVIFVAGTVGSSLEIAPPRSLTVRLGYRFR